MATFLNDKVDCSPAAETGGWQTVDMTAFGVGAGETCLIYAYNPDGAETNASSFGCRMTGSSDNNRIVQYNPSGYPHPYTQVLGTTNGSGQLDMYRTHAKRQYFLVGYFSSSEMVGFQDFINVTPGGAGTGWMDIDISAHVPATATFAIIQFDSLSNQGMNFRNDGSSDARQPGYSTMHQWAVVPLTSRIFEHYREVAENTHVYLMGYVTAVGTPNVNATNVSLSTTGSYQNIDLSGTAPEGAIAAVIETYFSIIQSESMGLRPDGAALDVYGGKYANCSHWEVVGLTSDIIEGKISDTDMDFYVVGYISTGAAPPVADFTRTPTSGTSPLSVDFTDTSTHTPTSWLWEYKLHADSVWTNFTNSTAQNPTQIFTTAGTYDVRLTATNAIGSDDETKSSTITVTAVTSAFSGTPLTGAHPLSVSFTDASTGSPSTWLWEYKISGGAWTAFTTSTVQNPTQVFTTGTYDVRLTASNTGSSSTTTKSSYVSAITGAGCTLSKTLPMFTIANSGNFGTITGGPSFPLRIIVAGMNDVIASFPMMLLQGGGYWTEVNGGELPTLRMSGWAYQTINAISSSLPMFTISALLTPPHTAAMTLPMFTISAASILGGTTIFAKALPRFTISASLLSGSVSTLASHFPILTIASTFKTGNRSSIVATLPMLTISSTGVWYLNITSTATLTLPMLTLVGILSNVVPSVANLPAIVMNVRTAAISRYMNYDFNSLTQYQDMILGGKSTGIYRMGGLTDAGTAIETELSSHPWDMGSPMQKRITDVYMSMRADGTYILQLTTEDGNIWETEFTDTDWNMHNRKENTPRGKKGKYWTWSLKSKSGSKIELDSIEFVTDVLKARK